MVLQSGADAVRGRRLSELPYASGARGAPEQSGNPAEKRDIKKVVLIAGLGMLSWVATYVGMLELIEANMGDLPLIRLSSRFRSGC